MISAAPPVARGAGASSDIGRVVTPLEDRAPTGVAPLPAALLEHRIGRGDRRRAAVVARGRPCARASRRASLTNWRTGSASKNSLATRMAGPLGHLVDARDATRSARRVALSAFSCNARSAGLVSTRCSDSAARNSGSACAARSASAISVPRPGPSSTSRTRRGRAHLPPDRRAPTAPISSPNIWLISGAVMKSPAAPSGSRVT